MAHFIPAADIDDAPARAARIGVLGFGNQGHAHALNLHEAGLSVSVGLRRSSDKWPVVEAAGLKAMEYGDCAAASDWVVMALPDQHMAALYADIEPRLAPGSTVIFVHGFGLEFGGIRPRADLDVVLVGPKGSGASLRAEVLAGRGLASLVAVHQDASGMAQSKALAYAKAIGAAWGESLLTTVREETVTDLFGEQAVLCGGVPALVRCAYQTLVDAGYSPELAYFECVHELKLITDLIYTRGLAGMQAAISETAAYGGEITGDKVIRPEAVRDTLAKIQSGEFARAWLAEAAAGAPTLAAAKQAAASDPIEAVAASIRAKIILP
ncbi:MAG: ketol-acid reductoisomerase [Chthonomonas sp.]|nr:ketol-acid reductoisomerase [Chthonomonas sp.]